MFDLVTVLYTRNEYDIVFHQAIIMIMVIVDYYVTSVYEQH